MTVEEDIRNAVDCMRKGGIILYPTDTIWGIGCDATNSEAVKKIYKLKQRADSKSMLVLVDSLSSLERIVKEIPETAFQLIDVAVKPLTIIYDDATGVAPELLSTDGSLGIRITNESYSNSLCRQLHRPVVSTSANISGEKSARNFSEISPEILKGVDYVATFRRNNTTPASPSDIIKINRDGTFKILR